MRLHHSIIILQPKRNEIQFVTKFYLYSVAPSTMSHSLVKYCLLFGILGLSAISISTNVITQKSMSCECFNTSTNANNQSACQDNVVQCGNTDSNRPSACFVLWSMDSLTGTVLPYSFCCPFLFLFFIQIFRLCFLFLQANLMLI